MLFRSVFALDNNQGLTPPLGFNTWNYFGCDINENTIMKTADAIVNLGLKEVGYTYINIDDCWMDSKRNEQNELVPHPTRFPHGIWFLASYCHQKGLKLGIYSSAGYLTCQRLPASQGYEYIDARTWAKWGIDYLKYDNCFNDYASAYERYSRMRDALNATGRNIYYSICNWGEENVWSWGKEVGNSWRTTIDISNGFSSVRSIYKQNIKLAKYAGPGGWNDPDMLEVGNKGMTYEESKTHFTLWAMAKSPLIIGCNLTNVDKEDLEILRNRDIIDLNQDLLGKQAECLKNCESNDFSGNAKQPQIILMELLNDDYGLAVTNWNDNNEFSDIKIEFSELLLKKMNYDVKDLWNKKITKDVSGIEIEKLKIHETKVFRLIDLGKKSY